MPLSKKEIAGNPGVRLVTPSWEELGGTTGVAVDLGIYQFYPVSCYIIAPMRGAFRGCLFRLFAAEEQEPADITLCTPKYVARAIWPHNVQIEELVEVTFLGNVPASVGWKELIATVDTITLPRVFPWLRKEQTVNASNRGHDIADDVGGEKGDGQHEPAPA